MLGFNTFPILEIYAKWKIMCETKKIVATKAKWFDLCGIVSRNSAVTQEIDAGLTTRKAFEKLKSNRIYQCLQNFIQTNCNTIEFAMHRLSANQRKNKLYIQPNLENNSVKFISSK